MQSLEEYEREKEKTGAAQTERNKAGIACPSMCNAELMEDGCLCSPGTRPMKRVTCPSVRLLQSGAGVNIVEQVARVIDPGSVRGADKQDPVATHRPHHQLHRERSRSGNRAARAASVNGYLSSRRGSPHYRRTSGRIGGI